MKNSRIAAYAACAALALLLSPLALYAQLSGNYQFTNFSYPGATGTIATAINKSGLVAGQWVDSSSNTHGFLFTLPNSFTSFDCSGATSTYPFGINDNGVVSGYYTDGGGNHGFTWTTSGGCTGFDYPSTSGITDGQGINNSAEVAGYYGNSSNPFQGFLDNGGTFSSFTAPGASLTYAQAINTSGLIAGYYYESSSNTYKGFTYNGTSFTTFALPNQVQWASGVNDAGIVTVESGNSGYLWQSGQLAPINYPSSIFLYGINNSKQIVGYYFVPGSTCSNSVCAFIGNPVNGKTLGAGCDCAGSPTVGHPITVSNGNLFEQATDYTTAGQNPLAFTRYYNSQQSAVTTFAAALGINWRSNFDRYLQLSPSTVIAERADGQQLTFTLSGSAWVTDSDVDVTLAHSGSTWTLKDHNDVTETYTAINSSEAQLSTIAVRNGYTQTMHYNSGHQLTSVTDSYSRSLTLTYSSGMLNTLATPDSTTITYGYTAAGAGENLTSVSFPTSPTSTLTYAYGASSAPPNALTSIVDENGNTYATWQYDSLGRANSSQLGTSADTTTLTFNSGGTVTVQNALGVQDTYTFSTLQNVPKVSGISRAATSTTAAATESFTYDTNGFLASATDWNGNQTTYVNDSHGDPTTINEAVGSGVARTTTISYDSTFVHLPHQMATTGLTSAFAYDTSGELLTRTDTDTTTTSIPYSTNGQTRTWTYTWSNFLLATAETPNSNTTHYGYSSSGAFTSITDALSHVTNITSNTGGGRPLTIVDPNGATNGTTTTLTYDARQRLTSKAVATSSSGTHTTTYTVDPTGVLDKVTLPDSSFLANTYDTAHRITQVSNIVGTSTDPDFGYITYALDALGDQTQAYTYYSGGGLTRQHSGTFDALGRMLTDVEGWSTHWRYTYDANGNALTIKDGPGNQTSQAFDALNRLTTITDANTPTHGVTQFAYDAHDRTLSVTDANGHATSYVYDGFGDAIQQASPDSGTTVYHYDADSNLTQKVDALSVTTNYTYDALDRIKSRSGTQWAFFGYDVNGGWPLDNSEIGRLSWMNDQTGYLYFGHDQFGNVNHEERTTQSGTRVNDIYINHDLVNRVSGLDYPSGLYVGFNRDTAGAITQVIMVPPGSTSGPTVAWVSHSPFGPVGYLTFGNSVTELLAQDQAYRITTFKVTATAGNLTNQTYTYDTANNLKTVADTVSAFNNQTLGYDTLNRLTSAVSGTGGYGSLAWAYDKVGNLTSQTVNSSTTTYGYTSGSNRLASITNGGTVTVSTNANGNITSIPPADNPGTAATFAYTGNRLTSVTGSPTAITSILYDGFGQRYSKLDSGSPITYVYDLDGNLIEENNSGSVTDYIYLDGVPVGVFVPGSTPALYYVHSDRQGTPQMVTNSSQSVVWSTAYQPYGTTPAIISGITQNLRFPGQYNDNETGFYHNGFRDYMPNLGRYLESDPIGLGGGIDPFVYARNNPGSFVDRSGLDTFVVNRPLAPIGRVTGNGGLSPSDPFSHTFVVTTNPDGTVEHTYSWGNAANPEGWNLDQPLDIEAAQDALRTGNAETIGDATLDPYVQQAFDYFNNPDFDHLNLFFVENCKAETKKLLDYARSLQNFSALVARFKQQMNINQANSTN